MADKLLTVVFATAKGKQDARAYGEYLVRTSGIAPEQVSVLAYPSNRRGLCSVYNEALRQADGRYVALLHDDLSFDRAPGWGRTLAREFEQHPQYSVLGVAGSSILQESGFWLHTTVSCGHIYHRKNDHDELTRFGMPHDVPRPVAALDGVFLVARTSDVRDLELDDETFDRFHFYDMEFCMQARARGLRLGVTDAIDLIHLSAGDFGAEWEQHRRRFVERYAGKLPSSALEDSDLFPFKHFSRKVEAAPSVGILIPTKDRVDLVRNAVRAIHDHTAAGLRYQIYVIDTGSSAASLVELKALPGVRVVELGYYNFAAIHNDVILRQELIDEDLILFHNNDVEFVNDVLSHLLYAWTTTRDCGVVGARLHFGNGLLQHGGIRICVDIGRSGLVAGHYGYGTLWNFTHDVVPGATGNTFALALIERELYRRIGGLNESYASCFEDVEMNLEAILRGRTNVFVGDAVALHHESLTRKQDAQKEATQARDFSTLGQFLNKNLARLTPHIEIERAPARPAQAPATSSEPCAARGSAAAPAAETSGFRAR